MLLLKTKSYLHLKAKLPFPLATHYKDMLQSGILTRDMDPRWISGLSWYILNLFGLRSLYKLILNSGEGTYPHLLLKKNFNLCFIYKL